MVVDRAVDELEIRRNGVLNGVVGLAASALGIAYLWRASNTGAALDFVLCAVLLVIGAMQLVAMVDARMPLLIADTSGVRIRLGREWRGLPWGSLDQVVVESRQGLLHDNRLVLSPRNLSSALSGIDGAGRRQVRALQRWYGAPLAVPLSFSTRTSTRDLVGDLRTLIADQTDVVVLAGREQAKLEDLPVADTQTPEPALDEPSAEADETSPSRSSRGRVIGGLGVLVSRVGKGQAHDVDSDTDEDDEPQTLPQHPLAPAAETSETSETLSYPSVAPLREPQRALRAEITREEPATRGNAALLPDQRESKGGLPEGEALRRREGVLFFEDDSNVRPLARPHGVEPMVIDEFRTEPALDPVIGPEIAAARTRARLSIDELSERTRIRPHVLESIEVDDFAPCGGDFYARGHLRTLARVLGLDPTTMMAAYDEHYAHAPINARRIFEAELATGLNGGMRSSLRGPRWSLLVGAVLCLLMAWGVARFLTSEPAQVPADSPVLGNSAGLAANHVPITSPLTVTKTLTVTDTGAPARVVVRDRTGAIVWAGRLVHGEHHRLAGVGPFAVTSTNAAAVSVKMMGTQRGAVGSVTTSGTRTFR